MLGILLGVVVDRTVIENHVKNRFTRMGNPRMIGFLLERVIQPTPEQRKKIEKILDNYADKMFETRHQVMKKTAALMDSLRHDLEPILTEEQKKRMEEHRMRFESWEKGKGQFRRRPMGPPFDGPPEKPFR